MPRKTCNFLLSRNSTKFYVLTRFRETIPMVKSVSSSEIQRINYGFLIEINNFVIEITILPFFQKLEFLGSYILPSSKEISSQKSGQLQSITCVCNVHSAIHVNSHLNLKRVNHIPSSLNKKGYVARIVSSRSHVESSTP